MSKHISANVYTVGGIENQFVQYNDDNPRLIFCRAVFHVLGHGTNSVHSSEARSAPSHGMGLACLATSPVTTCKN